VSALPEIDLSLDPKLGKRDFRAGEQFAVLFAVEEFDPAILCRSVRADEVRMDSVGIGPCIRYFSGKLRAVVSNDELGQTFCSFFPLDNSKVKFLSISDPQNFKFVMAERECVVLL